MKPIRFRGRRPYDKFTRELYCARSDAIAEQVRRAASRKLAAAMLPGLTSPQIGWWSLTPVGSGRRGKKQVGKAPVQSTREVW